jgi:hypothetical protein
MRKLMPDGRWMSVSGNDTGFVGPWAFMLWVRHPSGTFRVHTGARGSAEILVANSGRTAHTKIREASLRGSRLVSLEDREQGGTTLVWQGDFHELSTYVHGTTISFEAFASRMALLDVTDGRDGLVVLAGRGTGTALEYVLGANFIPDICSVSVRGAGGRMQPATVGKAVRGGRMWRDDETDGNGRVTRSMVTIANDTCVTSLSPFDPADARLRPLVESLDVRFE